MRYLAVSLTGAKKDPIPYKSNKDFDPFQQRQETTRYKDFDPFGDNSVDFS